MAEQLRQTQSGVLEENEVLNAILAAGLGIFAVGNSNAKIPERTLEGIGEAQRHQILGLYLADPRPVGSIKDGMLSITPMQINREEPQRLTTNQIIKLIEDGHLCEEDLLEALAAIRKKRGGQVQLFHSATEITN